MRVLRNGKPIADIIPIGRPAFMEAAGAGNSRGWGFNQPHDSGRTRNRFLKGILMRVFFDASAFVKRYIAETGTDTVLEWCDRATEIGLSGIASLPEIVSAFCRLRRENRITDAQYRQLKSLLLSGEDAAICDLTPAVMAQTISALENNLLRGMDAIHIGSAVTLKADVFVSADQRQLGRPRRRFAG